MKLFVAFLALVVVSASAHTISWPGFPEGRIINGQEASPGEAPFIVSLQTNTGSHFCGGSLIDANTVLTAAHCIIYDSFQVVAGAHSRTDKSETQIRKAVKSVVHEKYGGGVGPNDIALVFLEESFNVNARMRDGSAPVATIDLLANQFVGKSDGVLYGWGRDNSGLLPDKLQRLNVDIIDYDACSNALPKGNSLDKSNVCTYTAGTSDGACNGDSGGPLVAYAADGHAVQVGAVSWGYTPCATTKYPSVYTSIASHHDWIEEHRN